MSAPIHFIPPSSSEQVINSFSGEHEFLSNFYPCSIRLYGLLFQSAEQAFHWHKLALTRDRETLLTLGNPLACKRFSRKHEIIPDWDEYRTGIMLTVLIAKFGQNLDLKLRLLGTAPALLLEGNHWNDTFWGVVWKGEWIGENHLGRILMIIRDNL